MYVLNSELNRETIINFSENHQLISTFNLSALQETEPVISPETQHLLTDQGIRDFNLHYSLQLELKCEFGTPILTAFKSVQFH